MIFMGQEPERGQDGRETRVQETSDGTQTLEKKRSEFEQILKEWKYVYSEDDPQKIVDSNYVDMEYPAVAGKHFEILDCVNNEATLLANHNQLNLRVVVKRDDSNLKKNAYVLKRDIQRRIV